MYTGLSQLCPCRPSSSSKRWRDASSSPPPTIHGSAYEVSTGRFDLKLGTLLNLDVSRLRDKQTKSTNCADYAYSRSTFPRPPSNWSGPNCLARETALLDNSRRTSSSLTNLETCPTASSTCFHLNPTSCGTTSRGPPLSFTTGTQPAAIASTIVIPKCSVWAQWTYTFSVPRIS